MNMTTRMSDAAATVSIHGNDVKVLPGPIVTQEDLQCALDSKIFHNWVAAIDSMISVSEVTIQGMYYRGKPSPNSVLFIVMVASIAGAYPYSIILRGPSVIILPVLLCNGVEYIIGVAQRRSAIGKRFFHEVIAGMTDGDDIASKALDELFEETSSPDLPGLKIGRADLVKLGEHLEPSPGIMSEAMHFFYTKIDVTPERLASFEGRMTGVADEHEEILLKVLPLDQLLDWAPHDMKAEIAYRRYRSLFPASRPRK